MKGKIFKLIGLALLILGLGLGLVYLILASKDVAILKSEKPERALEFKNATICGWEEGQKVWEFYAKEGWTDRKGRQTTFENVLEGAVYQDDRPVLKNIKAKHIKVHERGKQIEAFREDEVLTTLVDLKELRKTEEDKREYAFLQADYLKYTLESKKTKVSGNIRMEKKDGILSSSEMEINHQDHTALLQGSPELVRNGAVLTAKLMKAYFEEDKIVALGKVKFIPKKEKNTLEETTITCQEMEFFTDDGNAKMSGEVEVLQKGKAAIGDKAIYSDKTKSITLIGRVKTVLERGSALLKKESIAKLKNPEAKKLLKKKTFLESNQLTILIEGGDALAEGNVVVTQKGRVAKAEKANYVDQDETITLTSNVFMKKEEEWLKTHKVIVSVKEETFEASGGVETEFKLKK